MAVRKRSGKHALLTLFCSNIIQSGFIIVWRAVSTAASHILSNCSAALTCHVQYDAAFDLVSMDENDTVCTDELVKAMQANSSFRVVLQVKLKMYESRKRMAESATGGLSVYHV